MFPHRRAGAWDAPCVIAAEVFAGFDAFACSSFLRTIAPTDAPDFGYVSPNYIKPRCNLRCVL